MMFARAALAAVLGFSVIYLFGAFAHWNLNAGAWDPVDRFFIGLIGTLLGCAVGCVTILIALEERR